MNTLRTFFSILLIAVICSSLAYAGEEYSERAIQNEISYLAKKLLDMSGEDSYTVEYPAHDKPLIGICSEINSAGILITCITPGSQADKAGLKTGDVVSEVNGIDMRGKDTKRAMRAFKNIVDTMKKGDVMPMKYKRGHKTSEITVTVGSISHPSYTLTINK